MSPASLLRAPPAMQYDVQQASVHLLPPPLKDVSDEQSASLQRAFQRSGGTATGDETALFLRTHCDQPVSLLARWIVQKKVISFVWRSQRYVPSFQLDLERGTVRAGITETISELSAAFDELETILWFCKPNGWLANAAPADVALIDVHVVIQAARADRYIVLG